MLALKDAVPASDGILFVSPEYNRSIPGALKNAIDWGSRPATARLLSHYMEEYGSFVARVLAANAPGHIGDEHPDKDKVTR
jgi:NAD(P)H-dependent FMN reductase